MHVFFHFNGLICMFILLTKNVLKFFKQDFITTNDSLFVPTLSKMQCFGRGLKYTPGEIIDSFKRSKCFQFNIFILDSSIVLSVYILTNSKSMSNQHPTVG